MTFEQWSEKAEAKACYKLGRDGERSVYQFPNGSVVYHEVFLPWNFLKPPYERAIPDIVVKKTKDMIALAKKYGAVLVEEPYSEGYYAFMFSSKNLEVDTLKLAWEFLEKEKERFVKEKINDCKK